jgi:hypothetical protein
MEARKVRFGILMAAAVVLPSTGYLLGFSKAHGSGDEDWSEELAINHELLSPTLAGIAALQHGDELKLTDKQRAAILKIVREDGPGLLKAQKEEWDFDLGVARKVFSGDEILMEFHAGWSMQKAEDRPYHKLEIQHLYHVQQVVARARWNDLGKIAQKRLQAIRWTRLFLIYDEKNAEILRLTDRQKKQFRRLESYQAKVVKEKMAYGYDGEFPTLSHEDAMRVIKSGDEGQKVFFSYQAEDFLDPIQQLQLRALAMDRTYVPLP